MKALRTDLSLSDNSLIIFLVTVPDKIDLSLPIRVVR